MNTDSDRQIRTWLATRDPGAAPARLRAAVADVSAARRVPRIPGLDYVRVRVLGTSVTVRPLVVLVVVLALIAAAVGAGLLWRWLQFPPKGLIAYTVPLEQAGSTGIRLIAADGTGGRTISKGLPNVYEHSPRWSPDGRTLAFARTTALDPFGSCPGVGSVVVYDMETGTERVLATDLHAIDTVEWSPAGDRIAFLWPPPGCGAPGELGVVDVATGQVTITKLGDGAWRIRWNGATASADDASSASSRNGDFVVVPQGEVPGCDLCEPFGRDPVIRLSVVDRAGGTAQLGSGSGAAWSPDDQAIAFTQFIDRPSENGLAFRDRLALASRVSGTWTVQTVADVLLPDAASPIGGAFVPSLHWSQDGGAIYWMDVRGGHVVEVASGRTVDLPDALDGCDDLQWQPMPH